ncbi:MAG: hypothetical protein FJ319_01595 [SAR202 cluster bacterium]|nr:hypothetical protein [SAR202 cluster bacterium]
MDQGVARGTAGVLLEQAEASLAEARGLLGGMETEAASERAYDAMLRSAQAVVLHRKGELPESDFEVIKTFESEVINTGVVDLRFRGVLMDAYGFKEDYESLQFPRSMESRVERMCLDARMLINEVREVLASVPGDISGGATA